MGMTLKNINFKTDKRDEVINAVKDEIVLVSPLLNGWVSIYEDYFQDEYNRASTLSRNLNCKAILFNVYDSDMFEYALFENGELKDKYNSNPEVASFKEVSQEEKEQLKGKPELLLPLCPPETRVEDLRKILDDDYTSEEKRAEDLAKILGIKNATWGYEYLTSDGDEQTVEGWKDFWNWSEQEENQQQPTPHHQSQKQ